MTDYNCFVGGWPFRKIRHGTLEDLRRLHRENDITGGFVSNSDAVFYQDPYEADEALAKLLAGSEYSLVTTVNPDLPGAAEAVEDGLRLLHAKGVRLYPGFHGYSLMSENVAPVMEKLQAEQGMLWLTLRVDDERSTYLFHPKTLEMEEVRAFLERYDQVPVILCNARLNEIGRLQELLRSRENLWFDCSGLKDGLFPKELLRQWGVLEQLRYGSMAPLFCMKSTVLLMQEE